MIVRLGEHFTAREFLVSKDYPDLAQRMVLSAFEINNLYLLCQFGLNDIRRVFGKTLILSGKRSEALNMSIHGNEKSQHLLAMAADFTCPGKDLHEVYEFIVHDLLWKGECIRYRTKNFIHLALPQYGVKADRFERP